MQRLFLYLVPALSLLMVTPSSGQMKPEEEALASCLADNTSGRDRKDLARWVFAALSNHPEMQTNTKYTMEEREQLDQRTAKLFERLLADVCKTQAKAANSTGQSGIRTAFRALGFLASQELMADAKVQVGLQEFLKHLDQDKINQALK